MVSSCHRWKKRIHTYRGVTRVGVIGRQMMASLYFTWKHWRPLETRDLFSVSSPPPSSHVVYPVFFLNSATKKSMSFVCHSPWMVSPGAVRPFPVLGSLMFLEIMDSIQPAIGVNFLYTWRPYMGPNNCPLKLTAHVAAVSFAAVMLCTDFPLCCAMCRHMRWQTLEKGRWTSLTDTHFGFRLAYFVHRPT